MSRHVVCHDYRGIPTYKHSKLAIQALNTGDHAYMHEFQLVAEL